MIEIIPTILVATEEEFVARVRSIETFAPMAQIDIIDGSWISGETWADPLTISNVISPLTYELHLMVANPIEHLDAWTELPSIKRVIFHIETVTQPKQVIEAIRFHGWEVGLALNPETPISSVQEFVQYVDEVMFLTVKPGASGRPFEHGALKKIESFAHEVGHAVIGVDGGISRETLPLCIDAGVTRLRVGNALTGTSDVAAKTWKELHSIAQHA